MFTTIKDAYQHFCDLHGGETPLRTLAELRDAIQGYDLRYEQVDARFWAAAFESGWASGETDELPAKLSAE